MASLPQKEQQRLLETVWKSRAVLSAWNRYCTRPLLAPLLPVIPIGIYGAIEKISTGWMMLVVSPIVITVVFSVRRYYKQQFLSVFRTEVLALLPSNISLKK